MSGMSLDIAKEQQLTTEQIVAHTIAKRVPVAVERMAGRIRDLIAGHTSFGSIALEVIPEDAAKNIRVAARIISLAVTELLGAAEQAVVANRYWAAGAARGSEAGGFAAGGASIRKALLASNKYPWDDAERALLLQLALTVLHESGNHAGEPDFAAIAARLNHELHEDRPVRSREGVGKQHRALLDAQTAENSQPIA